MRRALLLAALVAAAACCAASTRVPYVFQEVSSTVKADAGAMETVGVSAEAQTEALLQNKFVQAAINAKTPDAVDRLIQGILEGKGKGGVVTSEFNQGGVHATIISNVNELRVTQVSTKKEELAKKTQEERRKVELKELTRQTDLEIRKAESEEQAFKRQNS